MKRGRLRQRRVDAGLDPLSWSIFSVLVVSLFFKRLVDAVGTVTARDCDELPIVFLGPTTRLDGPMDWLLIIGLSAGALLIAQAVDHMVTRRSNLTFWALWTVNLALAGALIWAFLIAWAYFNPAASAARPIFQFTSAFAQEQQYVSPNPVGERDYQSEGDWIWDEAARTWTNEKLGLIRRYETIRACEPAGMRRAQLALVHGERMPNGKRIEDLGREELRQPRRGYVLYDLDGNYLVTLGGPYTRRSTITRERDAVYDPDRAAMSPEEAERRYFEWVRDAYQTPRPAPRPQPLSREEIDRLVAESWGDERPSWHEDD